MRVASLSRPSSSPRGPPGEAAVALPSARARPRPPSVTFLADDTGDDRDAFGHAGCAAARGGRSEACTVRPRGTGDGGTNIAITSEPAHRASARCETSSVSPGAGGGLAAHRRRRGAMLPTNLCLLTSTYEKPHPVHHPAWMRRGAAVSRTGDPLRRTAQGVRGRASDASVTAPIVGAAARADDASLSVWPSSSPPRSRDRSRREGEPRRLPSSKSPRPATPFRTPGSDLPPAAWRLRHAAVFATPFHRGETSRTSAAGPPCTRPVAGGSRFLGLGFACRLLLIGERRADSPWRAFDPRVASCRDHVAPTFVDGNDHFRPEPPRRVTRRAMAKRCACAFLDVPRAPGLPGR